MGILNNPVILRIRVPFQDFQPMEILNLELLPYPAASFDFAQDASTSLRMLRLRSGYLHVSFGIGS